MVGHSCMAPCHEPGDGLFGGSDQVRIYAQKERQLERHCVNVAPRAAPSVGGARRLSAGVHCRSLDHVRVLRARSSGPKTKPQFASLLLRGPVRRRCALSCRRPRRRTCRLSKTKRNHIYIYIYVYICALAARSACGEVLRVFRPSSVVQSSVGKVRKKFSTPVYHRVAKMVRVRTDRTPALTRHQHR